MHRNDRFSIPADPMDWEASGHVVDTPKKRCDMRDEDGKEKKNESQEHNRMMMMMIKF